MHRTAVVDVTRSRPYSASATKGMVSASCAGAPQYKRDLARNRRRPSRHWDGGTL